MEFGLFFLMQRDEAWSEQSVYDSGLAQMLAAESLGYGSVWIAEHHFNDYGLCPAPQVLASFVAARTKTLRLGMGVSLLPLHTLRLELLAREVSILHVNGTPIDRVWHVVHMNGKQMSPACAAFRRYLIEKTGAWLEGQFADLMPPAQAASPFVQT